MTSPKFYYFDAGVYKQIRPRGPLDSSDEIDGAALETLFLQHIKAINDYFSLNYGIYYWRTTTHLEVDFIIYGENGFYAFEIKRKQNISKKDLKGLLAFKADYPEAHFYLLYGGKGEYIENGVHIAPFENILKALKNIISPKSKKASDNRW